MMTLDEFDQRHKKSQNKIYVRLNGKWKQGKSKHKDADNILHVLQTMTAMAAQQNIHQGGLIAMNIQTTRKGRIPPICRGGGGELRDGDIWIELTHDHTYQSK